MYKMNDDTGHEYTDGYNDGYDDCKKEREAELAALRLDASSKWAFLEWRDRAEKAEAEIANLRAQIIQERTRADLAEFDRDYLKRKFLNENDKTL